jgi:hydroxypyruvate reductase
VVDPGVAAGISADELADALRRNDAYPLLDRVGGLLKTGPTHTNVCDLRVAVVGKRLG